VKDFKNNNNNNIFILKKLLGGLCDINFLKGFFSPQKIAKLVKFSLEKYFLFFLIKKGEIFCPQKQITRLLQEI
jgi:hypothetical protein